MYKNITLSADEALIQQARDKASAERSSLNEQFRGWLTRYVSADSRATEYAALMARLDYVTTEQSFSRDEMNER